MDSACHLEENLATWAICEYLGDAAQFYQIVAGEQISHEGLMEAKLKESLNSECIPLVILAKIGICLNLDSACHHEENLATSTNCKYLLPPYLALLASPSLPILPYPFPLASPSLPPPYCCHCLPISPSPPLPPCISLNLSSSLPLPPYLSLPLSLNNHILDGCSN